MAKHPMKMGERAKKTVGVRKRRRKPHHTSNGNHDRDHVHEESSTRTEATREVWQSNLNVFLTKMLADKK
jgi:hypothetical protein